MAKRKSENRELRIASKIPPKPSTAAAAASSAVPPPPWIELPGDVTANILGRLGAAEIVRCAQFVCTTWWKVCQEHPALWREIFIISIGPSEQERCITTCRRLVDRSQGQLIDLTLHCFGDDQLIHYVADRSSNLKHLRLHSCYDISGECLAKAVKKLPQLEELTISTIMPIVKAVDIENIGISCPSLKSFSFSGSGGSWTRNRLADDPLFDGIDLAIAKSMPNLRRLRLFENCVKDQGLEAILDGCPHLESLYIRQCRGLNLEGDAVKRCRDCIKYLELPSNSKRTGLLDSEFNQWIRSVVSPLIPNLAIHLS